MLNKNFIFSSESVTEGHPDKIADQISDSILDSILKEDKNARVAVETLVTTGLSFVSGEITTSTYVDIPTIARSVIKDIGYNNSSLGYDWETCSVLTSIDQQSRDIAIGVDKAGDIGAGDQGIMFGFAINETSSLMPAPIYYAHKLTKALARHRKAQTVNFLRPDGKAQVSVEYKNGTPSQITDIVLSTQHNPNITQKDIKEFVIESLIKKEIPNNLLKNTRYFVNPTGQFVEGGPKADTGLTGRKIIVDTYGGFSRNGGGAFSGKDPSKVDRSASYLARYIAKNLVSCGIASRIEIQLSYAIGVSDPISIFVEDFGTAKVSKDRILQAIKLFFPLKPQNIIEKLDLLNTAYYPVASYGHFGRDDFDLPWERLNKVEELREFFA